MAGDFTLGDVIKKARSARRWTQTRLGAEAGRFEVRGGEPAINKSTVSKVERDPYSSEFGTVWRLLAALGLKFSDVEKRVGLDLVRRDGRAAYDGAVPHQAQITALVDSVLPQKAHLKKKS